MSISLLYGCAHLEMCTRDLDATRAFLERVLNARPIEQQLAREIGDLFPDGGYRVDHLDCGNATFQINEPSSTTFHGRKLVHQGYLERVGPCVTNLNYFVDDIVHAKTLLNEMGAETLIEGPSSVSKSLSDYGPGNTRPGAETRPFLFLGARPLIGLDLELMEPNFLRFADQEAQQPCFVRPDSTADTDALRFQRLNIAVDDLDRTYRNVVALFTPGSRSKPYDIRDGSLARTFRMHVGGIEVQYCQPLTKTGAVAEHLQRHGPGVVALEFAARDVPPILERARGSAAPAVDDDFDLVGDGDRTHRWRIASQEVAGFDIMLEAATSWR